MSDRAPIPNLPPISSIKDPDVRVALESMWNAWRVRNGDVGDGEHKFLTAADLKDALTTTTIVQGGGGYLGTPSTTNGKITAPNTGWIKPLLDKIDDYIQQSYLWKLLGERIDWIETPEWFIEKIDASIGTKINNEQKIREAADSSLASSITTVSAVLNGNIALVKEELTANVTLTEATATKVTTLQTQFNDNVAQVQNSIKTLTSADVSLTNQINQAISNFNGQIAGVKTQIQTVSNSVSALSQSTTTNFTNVNNNLSLIRTDVKSVTDLAGSNASKITTLQTSVAGVKTSAENALNLATTIDGQIKGAWTVKFDANGYVTGAGLSLEGKGGNIQSAFYVRADQFVIGTPQYPNVSPVLPFRVFTTTQTIGGETVPPGVYITNAMIANGSINSAKIGFAAVGAAEIADAAVNTLKIAGNAVTQPIYSENPATQWIPSWNNGVWHSVHTFAASYEVQTKVLAFWSIFGNVNDGGDFGLHTRILVDGWAVVGEGVTAGLNNAPGVTTTQFGVIDSSPGYHTYTLQVYFDGDIRSQVYVNNRKFFILGAKR